MRTSLTESRAVADGAAAASAAPTAKQTVEVTQRIDVAPKRAGGGPARGRATGPLPLAPPPPGPVPGRAHIPPPRPPAPAAALPPAPVRSDRPPLRPSMAAFVVVFPVVLAVSVLVTVQRADPGPISWVTTVLWTLPFASSVIGLLGGLRTVRTLRTPRSEGVRPVRSEALIVVLPTIGRFSTQPALERAVRSFCRFLPALFPNMRIDLVVEQDCEAMRAIGQLALASPMIHVVTVPRSYRTPAGTRFKARANHYAHEQRLRAGEARPDVWILHMDDDTGVGADTAEELARFVAEQRRRGADALHLTQGVLTYPREQAASRVLWLADAVRPASDIGLFAFTTGRGSPSAGLHGELLLVRASVEAQIGWDFGPRAVVEDAQFALYFCQRFPGRSGWMRGRSSGATPVNLSDFLRQRERWAWGLLELAVNPSVRLRDRLMLLHNLVVWTAGPFQHLGVVLLAGVLLGDTDTAPVVVALLPLWAVNVAFAVWQYWEGLKINARASAHPRRHWWEPVAVTAMVPIFSLWEGFAVLRGFIRFLRRGETRFDVIAKPL